MYIINFNLILKIPLGEIDVTSCVHKHKSEKVTWRRSIIWNFSLKIKIWFEVWTGHVWGRVLLWKSILTFRFEIIIKNWKLYWRMVARVRDPNRWMGGRPGPHAPSEVIELHATITARPRRQKEARVRARPNQSGGGGEDGFMKPPPTPSEVMPRYDP